MESPQIWGPHLWIILHSLAERIKGNSQEERRLWSGLLSNLRFTLPCPQCKKHYSEYYASNKISENSEIRLWLYNLHNQVNIQTGKECIPVEELSVYSKPFNFTQHVSFIHKHMISAIRYKCCKRDDIQCITRLLNEIKCFYDLF